MHDQLHRWIAIVGLVTGVAAGGCAHHPHGHHGGRQDTGLTVLGSGEAKSAPDVARVSIGIEVRAESAEQATAQANERMAAVIAALKAAGVAANDLRTSDFSVSFERDFAPPTPEPLPAQPGTRAAPAAPAAAPRGSYRVSNTVEVLVRDTGLVSQVLTAATSAGANNVWGIQFDLLDHEPLHAKAREQAIAHAKQSAAQLAQLAGVKLGRIVTIDDQASGAEPRMYAAALRMEKADSAQVPVESGELTVRHQVRLVYELEP